MSRQLAFFTLIGLLSLTDLSSQVWTQYTEGRNIDAITEYNEAIWVATDAGLVRLSENEPTVFYNTANSLLPSHLIYDLEVLSDNKLYISTNEGLVIYDGTEFQIENDFGTEDLHIVQDVAEDSQGNIWVAASGIGLLKNEGFGWDVIIADDDQTFPLKFVRHLHIDKDDRVWVGYTDSGIAYYDIATNSTTQFDKDNSVVGKKEVTDISSLENGEVWVATIGGGMHRYVNDEWEVFSSSNTQEIKSNFMYSVIPGLENDLWIGTNSGLLYYKDGVWDRIINYADNKPIESITSVFLDRNARMWNGTRDGLFSGNDLGWRSHNTSLSTIPHNFTAAVRELQDGTLWIGSFKGDRGLYSFDGSDFTDHTEDLPVGLYNGIIELEVNDKGYIAAAAGFINEIFLFDGNEWQSQTLSTSVNDFEFDVKDNLWASTINGIYRISQGGTTLFDMSNTNMISDRFYDLVFDKEGILYAASSKGLISYDGNNWDQINIDNPILNNGEINGVFFDKDNRLWVAHDGGISVRKDDTWTNFNSSNSPIPNDQRTFRIIQDNQGVIWATMFKGLMRIVGNDWKLFTTLNSGLTRNDANDIYPARNGGIWISTRSGLIYHKDLNVSAIIDQGRNELNLVLYPNPANDQVLISLDEYIGKASIKLLDSQGQLIIQKIIQATQRFRIDLPQISGIYWMHINTEVGQQTIKVVKP